MAIRKTNPDTGEVQLSLDFILAGGEQSLRMNSIESLLGSWRNEKADPRDDAFNVHYTTIIRYALGLCRDADAATDLVMDAFACVMPHLQSIEPAAVYAYWKQAVHRKWIDRGRKESRVAFVPLEHFGMCDEDVSYPEPICDRHGPVQCAESALVRVAVNEALAQLTEEQRSALEGDLQGLSLDEVAARTGTKTGTLKSRRYRGRAALSKTLNWVVEA